MYIFNHQPISRITKQIKQNETWQQVSCVKINVVRLRVAVSLGTLWKPVALDDSRRKPFRHRGRGHNKTETSHTRWPRKMITVRGGGNKITNAPQLILATALSLSRGWTTPPEVRRRHPRRQRARRGFGAVGTHLNIPRTECHRPKRTNQAERLRYRRFLLKFRKPQNSATRTKSFRLGTHAEINVGLRP